MDVAESLRASPASLPHGGTDASLVPAPPADGGERMTLNLFFEERDDRWFPGDRRIRLSRRDGIDHRAVRIDRDEGEHLLAGRLTDAAARQELPEARVFGEAA